MPIEEVIDKLLSGDTKTNAQDFLDYLKANEMTAGGEHGDVRYKGKCVCYMHIDGKPEMPGPWTVWPEGNYSGECEAIPLDERMKETAWSHVNFCASCGSNCSPGTRKTVLGKEFDGVCGSTMAFTDPGAEALDCLKALIKMRKAAIDGR